MEVRVKYQVVSRATISSISYNHHYDLLAFIADGNDTASFFSPQPHLSLTPRFTGQSKPPSSGHISWSPNGMFIAVANIKVELWKFDGAKMAPFRVVNEGYIQIKGIAWSQDSKHYVCYGITPKDTPLSINIRNIQTNQLKQIITHDTPILVNFDPFGKYIAVLMLKNNLDLYDASTLDKIRSISLAENKNDIPTLRDKRLADWSPEYSYLFCPNLHDSKIPTAIIFDRNKNFAIKDILIGHQSPISCAKFNPQVFEYQHDTTFILAVGDSSGCLSIWRIGKINSYKQPLFIASSPDKAQQSIEGIQWNTQGNILFINVLKKYIVMMGFKQQDFGRKLSEEEKSNLIISTYGASGVNQITNTRLQVFGQSDIQMKNQIQMNQPPKVTKQNSFHQVQEENKAKQPLIKTKQQTFYIKDANNKQKKRINPSKLIPESSIIQNQQQQVNQKIDVQANGHNISKIAEKLQLPVIKLPSIKQDIKKQYTLPNNQILIIQNVKNVYILSIKSRNSFTSESMFKRSFNGQIKFITITRFNIFVFSLQKIFIFDFKLKLTEMPCFIGEVSNIAVNNQGTIYYLTSNGIIRGFNYLKHQFLLQTSIAYLLLTNENSQITSNPLLMFSVFDRDNDRIHVQLKTNLSRYFFCKQTNSWLQFDFQEGFYVPGHSLRITKMQKVAAQHFYRNLIAPSLIINPQDKNESAVSTFQLQLIYYRLYAKDIKKYKDSIVKMLGDLKIKGNNQLLRSQIINYFIDKNSPNFIGDRELWQKVKRIGGKVIQQFMILSQS